MKYYISLITLAFILIGYRSYPADNPKLLTLNECITVALQNNTAILVSEEDKKKAMAEYRVARGQRLPMLSFDIRSQQYPKVTGLSSLYPLYFDMPENLALTYYDSKKQKEDEKNEFSRYYNLGISLGVTAGVTLYSEKKARTQETAKKGIKLSKYQSQKVIGDVIFNVKKSYYSYMIARESVMLRQKLLASNRERLKLTEILFKNALKPILDLTKARYESSDAELSFQKAQNEEREKRMELFRTVGVQDPGGNFTLDDKSSLRELRYSPEELYKLGDQYFPDLQIAKTQTQINRLKVKVEKGGHYPEVELQAGASYENGSLGLTSFGSDLVKPGNWKPSGFVAFVARLPLFSGGIVSARIDSAQADYHKALYKEKETVLNMQATIDNIHTTLRELQKQVALATLMKENADKSMLLAKKSYESGAGTQLDLHEANLSIINAEMAYLKAKFDYLMTMAKLSSIVGLGEDSLCKKQPEKK